MTKQMTKIAAMVILAIGLTAGTAMSQKLDDSGFAPVGIYTGTESAEGALELNSGIRYGNSFVLNSFGEWESHHLTVSLDYATDQFVPNNFLVTGGSWSLVVFRDNQYAGTVYGKVQTGSVNITTNSNGDDISKQVQIILEQTGGMGIFGGSERPNIIGVYDTTTDLRSNETTGRVNFNF